MLTSTKATAFPRRLLGHYGSQSLQGQPDSAPSPIAVEVVTTAIQLNESESMATTNAVGAAHRKYYVPTVAVAPTEEPSADAAVIQVWEGTVLSVDRSRHSMVALLHAKIGAIADHSGEIDLEWVSDQDVDLVCPGAVFYLTLYKKRSKGGTIENAQELRFRRRPSWSRQQIANIDDTATRLLSKLRPSPDSND